MSDFNDFLSGLDNDAKSAVEAEEERKRKSEEAEQKRKAYQRAEEAKIRSELSVHYKIAEEFKAMAKQAEAVVVKNKNLKEQFYFDAKLYKVEDKIDNGLFKSDGVIKVSRFDSDSRSKYSESRKLLDKICGNIYISCRAKWTTETGKYYYPHDMLCILFLVCGSEDQFLHRSIMRNYDSLVKLTETPLMVMGRNNPENYFLCRLIDYFIYDYYCDSSFGIFGEPNDKDYKRHKRDFDFTYSNMR